MRNPRSRGSALGLMLFAAPLWAGSADDEALYTMGVTLGQQLRQSGVTAPLSMQRIEQGIKDGLGGRQATGADQMRVQAYLRNSADAAAARNAAGAHAWLSRHAGAAGVKTTASGLQYEVLQTGDAAAPPPRPADFATVNFRGTLLDGTEFASSAKPGTASTVQVNGVMRGWTEALTLMRPGAKWRLFVPPELGYGQSTRPGVPGGSLLIYDIELLRVAPAPAEPPGGGVR